MQLSRSHGVLLLRRPSFGLLLKGSCKSFSAHGAIAWGHHWASLAFTASEPHWLWYVLAYQDAHISSKLLLPVKLGVQAYGISSSVMSPWSL